jgi:peptide/nickel transport system substrate-binding protein
MKFLRLVISLLLALWIYSSLVPAARGAELRFALPAEPKTVDPFLVADESAEALRYLTEGSLIRVNRQTQRAEPELAVSWKVLGNGTKIVFQLRQGVVFPGGAPFTSADVVDSFEKLLAPALHSPIADTFRTANGVAKVSAPGKYTVVAEFPALAAQIERMFDQVSIVSASAPVRPAPGLGAFVIAERKPGVSILLRRNPTYWKRDADGTPLPRLDSIRIDIEQNRDLELLRFRRGELQLIEKLTADMFDRLASETPGTVVDAGPTLDSEFLWFNESRRAPIGDGAKEWFQSRNFRRAISLAIHRDDLCRVVYKGHASPAAGPVSPANKLWFNSRIAPDAFNIEAAMKLLKADGFTLQNGILRDRMSRAVEFSVVTNAGSKTRERMAAMIQQDLAKAGIRLNIVTLDFPSLLERITRSLNYEACILGLVNVDADPSELMNILLSSASNHPWNPSEKSPETEWEAEIDRLMLAQASTADHAARAKSFDRVQEILHDQDPVIYLLHPNALAAVSPQVGGAKATAFFPHTFWDAEHLTVKPKTPGGP